MAALRGYRRLPFSGDNIPGAYVEAVIAKMRDANVLRTYDFVDVIDLKKRIGWQVKSTMSVTPVTWKRAKLPNALALIESSQDRSSASLQALGDAIIGFCNEHARESMRIYDLDAIGYARVYVTGTEIVYFERELLTSADDELFKPSDFEWRWSVPKRTVIKEQLPALHGIHRVTNQKWFAWHGLGENQLHFSGEKAWWPSPESENRVAASLPDDDVKIPFEAFVEWVATQEQAIETYEA